MASVSGEAVAIDGALIASAQLAMQYCQALVNDATLIRSGPAAARFWRSCSALATALWILWPRHLRIYLALAGLVAASRFIIDAHYLSDVIAGCFIGAVVTLALRRFFERRGYL